MKKLFFIILFSLILNLTLSPSLKAKENGFKNLIDINNPILNNETQNKEKKLSKSSNDVKSVKKIQNLIDINNPINTSYEKQNEKMIHKNEVMKGNVLKENHKTEIVKTEIKSKNVKSKVDNTTKNGYVDFSKVASKVKLKPQEADFSEYGVNKEDLANLMDINEYQKKHGDELRKVVEERRQRYEEEQSIKDKIDKFFE